jgi:Mor family transcriptional regulator
MQYEGEWIDQLTAADFPRAFQDLVQLIGVRATVQLSEHFGGLQFYVPKPDALLQKKRDDMIRADRSRGMGYRDLAVKYKLTEVWIRQICDHHEDSSQLSLLD